MGFMGCGKSSIASHISESMQLDYIDTDQEIERHQTLSISELFDRFGEPHFRNLELELAHQLSNYKQSIISTGGGFLLQKEVSQICQKLGPIVFLKTSFKTILDRLNNDESRPLARNRTHLEALYNSRQSEYERLASWSINTDNKTIEDISQLVWSYYENYSS